MAGLFALADPTMAIEPRLRLWRIELLYSPTPFPGDRDVHMHRFFLPAFLLLVLGLRATATPPDFDKQIAPLLAARCLDCHSGAKPKGDLDLSRRANADAAEIGKRVAAGEMPPKKPLPAGEAQLLKSWIDSGAKWGTDPIDPFRFTTATRAGYDWWSLQPVRKPVLPAHPDAAKAGFAAHPIDQFTFAKLAEKKLTPSAPADRRTLIRRVTFDLLGLPPSPDEVEAFVNDRAPDAYEKVIDRLLASPHYGERWARHWLDVVRYGESDGFERNSPRPNAWHYRDWVVRSLNADLPYDEFVRLQIAGDVLKPGDAEAVRATGFLVAGVHNTVLGNDQMRAVARQDELEALVGAVGQTFLGMTVNCARCHDHKFDPISQTDFYRLASAISGSDHGERPLPDTAARSEIARLAKQLATQNVELTRLEQTARATITARNNKAPVTNTAAPVAAWDFRISGDDRVGKLHAPAHGNAKLSKGGATLDGKTGFLRTPPLPFELKAKTLEAWVKLAALTQRGGGVMSIQSANGSVFDAIVYGEQEPARWMAGSEFFRRTKSFGGNEETAAPQELVHLAITYAEDGTISAYRNGKPYGKAYTSAGIATYPAGKAVVVFGCRHEPAGSNKMLAGAVTQARLYDRALSATEIEGSYTAGGAFLSDAEIDAELPLVQRVIRASLRNSVAATQALLERLRAEAAAQKAYVNVHQNPGITKLLLRGDLATPDAIVPPGGLSALANRTPTDFELPPDAPDAARRVKLANWVTHPENPLFARVLVNRVWHYHFGTGLVETPSDFGFNAGTPSHPELLDWLAFEFQANKLSLKALHKLIVTSATYQQSSALRPEALAQDASNRLLWRYQPRRLEGEAVRDAMLTVAGLLNREIGGKGFSDYKERNFNGTAYFDPFDPAGPAFHRRSIYRFLPRGANQGLLDTFDCPDPSAAAPRRASTTTPLQALVLWNNGFALRMADALAGRITQESPEPEQQIRRAWQHIYQRDPSPEEAKLAAKLVADHGLKALCRALFNSNEFVTVE